MNRVVTRWLPPARIQHPHPDTRFDAHTQGRSRQCAADAGICAGPSVKGTLADYCRYALVASRQLDYVSQPNELPETAIRSLFTSASARA
jgi:hypothetical protein